MSKRMLEEDSDPTMENHKSANNMQNFRPPLCFSELPMELLTKIFALLGTIDARSFVTAMTTCRSWRLAGQHCMAKVHQQLLSLLPVPVQEDLAYLSNGDSNAQWNLFRHMQGLSLTRPREKNAKRPNWTIPYNSLPSPEFVVLAGERLLEWSPTGINSYQKDRATHILNFERRVVTFEGHDDLFPTDDLFFTSFLARKLAGEKYEVLFATIGGVAGKIDLQENGVGKLKTHKCPDSIAIFPLSDGCVVIRMDNMKVCKWEDEVLATKADIPIGPLKSVCFMTKIVNLLIAGTGHGDVYGYWTQTNAKWSTEINFSEFAFKASAGKAEPILHASLQINNGSLSLLYKTQTTLNSIDIANNIQKISNNEE